MIWLSWKHNWKYVGFTAPLAKKVPDPCCNALKVVQTHKNWCNSFEIARKGRRVLCPALPCLLAVKNWDVFPRVLFMICTMTARIVFLIFHSINAYLINLSIKDAIKILLVRLQKLRLLFKSPALPSLPTMSQWLTTTTTVKLPHRFMVFIS